MSDDTNTAEYWKREAELWRDRAREWRQAARDLADKLDAAERAAESGAK